MTEDSATVQLLDVPVARYLQMQQHHDAMLREFALIVVGAEDPSVHEVPRRLLELITETRSRHPSAAAQLREGIAAAESRGQALATLRLQLPLEVVRWVGDLLVLFDEADDFCRTGDLLTPPSSPEVVHIRQWLVGEIMRQASDGAAPTPFQE
ncbi:MAG: hypothetical protein H0V19_04115 [Euzebyales bacterium]|nr:hypothetical protein [Euzebyales bacterium]